MPRNGKYSWSLWSGLKAIVRVLTACLWFWRCSGIGNSVTGGADDVLFEFVNRGDYAPQKQDEQSVRPEHPECICAYSPACGLIGCVHQGNNLTGPKTDSTDSKQCTLSPHAWGKLGQCLF